MNKEFERCCTFLAEMMEKYGVQVLRDIAVEIQFDPETWCDDAEGKRLRYEAYAKRFLKRMDKAASCESGMYTYDRAFKIVRLKVYHRSKGGIEIVGLIVYR